MKIKVEGFKELERALAELPKATGKNILRKVTRGALEPMADQAAAQAPSDTGKLSFSIAVSEKRTRRARGKPKVSFINGRFRSDRSTGIEMAMGPAGGMGALNYASFVEYGTVDTAAAPYMRPAWDAGAPRALDYVKRELAERIEKSAARLARKRARAAGA